MSGPQFLLRSCFKALFIMAALISLQGCGGVSGRTPDGEIYSSTGQWDKSVQYYQEALGKDPEDIEIRNMLSRSKWEASLHYMKKGKSLLEMKKYDEAITELQMSLAYNPGNDKALEYIESARAAKQSIHLYRQGVKYIGLEKFTRAREAFEDAVRLDPRNAKAKMALEHYRREEKRKPGYRMKLKTTDPVSLKFKKAPVIDVFEVLAKLTGMNFIFDRDMRPSQVTLFMKDVSFDRFLEVLLQTSGLAAQVVSEDTILVYPDTPAKIREYQDLQVRTLYLANIEAKKAASMLAKIMKSKSITVNEELNAVVIRGSKQAVDIAAKIIEANDRAPAEVLLNVEILEVSRQMEENLGLEFSESVTFGLGESSESISNDTKFASYASFYSLGRLSNKEVLMSLPTATFNLLKKDGDTRLLAKPQLRVKNREKALIHIGERIPLQVNRRVDTNNNVTYDYQYYDIGIKFEAEPVINIHDEIELKVHLTVSSLGMNMGTVTDKQYAINTRTSKTVLSMNDGDLVVIGGLISDEEREDVRKVPGLGDLPGIGSFFTNNDSDHSNKDILMTITPVVIRSQDIPEGELTRIWTGKETRFSTKEPFESYLERKAEYIDVPVKKIFEELEGMND